MNRINVFFAWVPGRRPIVQVFRYPRDTEKLKGLIRILQGVLKREEERQQRVAELEAQEESPEADEVAG